VKLSNALKAAQSRDPWFVVLTAGTGAQPKIYAVRVWGALLKSTLKAVRQASIKGAPLHRKRLATRFGDEDLHTDDLIGWMKGAIDAVGPDYGGAKRHAYETVGYPRKRALS
jgi:hypothetical protein